MRTKTADILLRDLDRCPHGRHRGDACAGWRGPDRFDGGCQGGVSVGNPLIKPGQHIGYGLYGEFVVAPDDLDEWGNPDSWYRDSYSPSSYPL